MHISTAHKRTARTHRERQGVREREKENEKTRLVGRKVDEKKNLKVT